MKKLTELPSKAFGQKEKERFYPIFNPQKGREESPEKRNTNEFDALDNNTKRKLSTERTLLVNFAVETLNLNYAVAERMTSPEILQNLKMKMIKLKKKQLESAEIQKLNAELSEAQQEIFDLRQALTNQNFFETKKQKLNSELSKLEEQITNLEQQEQTTEIKAELKKLRTQRTNLSKKLVKLTGAYSHLPENDQNREQNEIEMRLTEIDKEIEEEKAQKDMFYFDKDNIKKLKDEKAKLISRLRELNKQFISLRSNISCQMCESTANFECKTFYCSKSCQKEHFGNK